MGTSRPGLFDGYNHYDNSGHKIGHSDPGFFSGFNHYDNHGQKTGHTDPGFFGNYKRSNLEPRLDIFVERALNLPDLFYNLHTLFYNLDFFKTKYFNPESRLKFRAIRQTVGCKKNSPNKKSTARNLKSICVNIKGIKLNTFFELCPKFQYLSYFSTISIKCRQKKSPGLTFLVNPGFSLDCFFQLNNFSRNCFFFYL